MERLDNFDAYSVGDTLTVAPDLGRKGLVNQYKTKFAGQEVTIELFLLDKDLVIIEEDPNKFVWTPRCFVNEAPSVSLSEFLIGGKSMELMNSF